MRLLDPEKHAARETRILDTARRLFAEKGYQETGVRDIADALGLTKAALYHYYPGKERILQAILENRKNERDQLVEGALRAEDLIQALRRLAEGFYEIMQRPAGKDMLLILVSEGVRKTEVGDLFHRIIQGYIRDFTAGAVHRGLICSGGEENCRAVLYAFLGGLVHYVLDRTYHGKPAVDLDFKEYGRLLSSVVGNGLLCEESSKGRPTVLPVKA
jgi:AcrR family transcriptional regulator